MANIFNRILFFGALLMPGSIAFGDTVDAVDLLLNAYRSSGNNPSLIRSGFGEFELVSESSDDAVLNDSLKKSMQDLEDEVRRRFVNAPEKLESELKRIRESYETALLNSRLKKETLSILMLGNDNSFRTSGGEQCKRRLDVQEFIPTHGDSGKKDRMPVKRVLSAGSLNQKGSIVSMEWVADANVLYVNDLFQSKSEFQSFGRMRELGGSETACIFRAKINSSNFTVPANFAAYFEQELKKNDFSCDVMRETVYDGSMKAIVVEIKKGGQLLEEYHIDPSRGYICPYLCVVHPSGGYSTECIAKDFFLDDTTGLYYPEVFIEIFKHPSVGVQKSTYRIKAESLRFNQPVSNEEFAVDIPEDATIHKIFYNDPVSGNTIPNPPMIVYHAVRNGTVSLSKGGYDFDKMKWLIKEEAVADSIPSRGGATGYVRVALMSIGIIFMMVAFAWMLKKRYARD